jgi:large subunit ribosomal protein L20
MRVKGGPHTRRRHKKIRKMAKGYYGQKSKTFRKANEQILKSLYYSYVHRKEKKRDFRRLWIVRINAALRNLGLKYSEFMHKLKNAGININRKMLAYLAVNEPDAFEKIVETVKGSVE